eukprot:5268488-Prymnesium_polylepis.1
MGAKRVSWWDGYSRPWQLPARFLGGAAETGLGSPTTATVPRRVSTSCADEGSPVVGPFAHKFPSAETDALVNNGDAEAQSQLLEAHLEEVIAAPEAGVSAPSGVGPPALQSGAGPPADGNESLCTAAALRKRLDIMLGEDGECPRPSGLGRCAEAPTSAWVIAARDAVSEEDNGFWRLHSAAVKARCAPKAVDEMDVLGFLGAEMFGPGGALLHHDDANGVGKRMQVQAGRADAAIKQAEKTRNDAVRRAKGCAKKMAVAKQTLRVAREKQLSKECELKLAECRFITGSLKRGSKAGAKRKAPKQRTPTSAELAERAAALEVDAADAAVDAAMRRLS